MQKGSNPPVSPARPGERDAGDPGPRRFAIGLVAAVAIAALLRTLYLTADPPWHAPVGVVWHDEGAWTHNARNRVLFGDWRIDEWNPLFIAPVFTALEYWSFATLGVGLWQARLVSAVAGIVAVALSGLGTARVGGRAAGMMAAALLATSYVSVMFDRAALMEATMVGLLVTSWWCYTRASRSAPWGAAAGIAAVLAYFTKASAVFFLAAIGLDALLSLARSRGRTGPDAGAQAHARAAIWTIGGLALGAAVAVAVFVGPYWEEYRFYNWQVSVARKPEYTLRAFLDRASWLPIVHDFFTRMWLVTAIAAAALPALLLTWRARQPAERLVGFWIALGVLELIVHDVGNERRLVFLIPPAIILAALVLGRDRRLLPVELRSVDRRRLLLWSPLVALLAYVVVGSVARLPFLYEVRSGVRWSAAIALGVTAAMVIGWGRLRVWLSGERWSPAASAAIVAIVLAGNLIQYGQWAASRTYLNYEASRALGARLAPGTPVHGKLANGLALENGIKPIFVGRGFGNYDDRLLRHDVPYLLTYVAPRTGYEGPVILEVLDAYPSWRILYTFPVAETAGGQDRAALIDKGPPANPPEQAVHSQGER